MKRTVLNLFKIIMLLFHSSVFSQWDNFNRIDPGLQERIDNFIENIYLPEIGASGCGFAIVQNGKKIAYTTGYGYANINRKIPNGNQTQFLLASISKTVTALLVAKTLSEHFPDLGEAVLDTPIQKLMPQVKFTSIDRIRSEYSTFRDLIFHKMCLDWSDFPMLMEAMDSTEEMTYRQRYVKEICGFRSQNVYNNQMILLAAELIGKFINKNFVDYTEEFLKELGMDNSAFIRETDDFSKMESRAMPYYIVDGKKFPTNPDLVKRVAQGQSSEGLYASPNDMARFIRLLLNKGKIDGKQVVPEKVISWLSKPSTSVRTIKFKSSKENNVVISYLAHGFGLVVGTYNGWERISHAGAFAPYLSDMTLFPALHLGIYTGYHESPIVVTTKTALHTFVFEAVRSNDKAEQLAMEHLEQIRIENESEINLIRDATSKFLRKFRKLGGASTNFNVTQMIGKYGNKVFKEVNVYLKYNIQTNQSGLYFSYGKWAKGWLESIGTSVNKESEQEMEAFKIDWDTDIVQDNFANWGKNVLEFATILSSGEFRFMVAMKFYGMVEFVFKKGVEIRLEDLDSVPWKKDRCE